ncbi:MAG: hypothetical protein IJ019_01310 [Alphaproteobacteria bacterium]|nr:hypothetical protein [Alphaproteobacteria bacterium]
MKKIIYWIGAILFVLASILILILFSEDLVLSVGVILYHLVSLTMLIGVDFKFKPYEWLMLSIGIFSISLMLVFNLQLFWCIVPILIIFTIMIIIRYCKKDDFGRMILMLFIEILCGILVVALGFSYKTAKAIENMEYEQNVVKSIHNTQKDFNSIEFENLNQIYTIDKQKSNLLRQGDTVYVKIYDGNVVYIKR